MNALVPAWVAQRYAQSRIVAFSTSCVYPFVDVAGPGAAEDTPIGPPPGEYANSCVGRERMFEYFSRVHGTAGRLIRLSYAIDMRYGVLHDVGRKVLRGEPVELAMGHCNVIWQGDANEYALRALAHCTTPTSPLNVSGPRQCRSGHWRSELGDALARAPQFTGAESATAWLIDTRRARELLGEPRDRRGDDGRLVRRLAAPRHAVARQAHALRGARRTSSSRAMGPASRLIWIHVSRSARRRRGHPRASACARPCTQARRTRGSAR